MRHLPDQCEDAGVAAASDLVIDEVLRRLLDEQVDDAVVERCAHVIGDRAVIDVVAAVMTM